MDCSRVTPQEYINLPAAAKARPFLTQSDCNCCNPHSVTVSLSCEKLGTLSITSLLPQQSQGNWTTWRDGPELVSAPDFVLEGQTVRWSLGWQGICTATVYPSYDWNLCKFKDLTFGTDVALINDRGQAYASGYQESWIIPGNQYGYGDPYHAPWYGDKVCKRTDLGIGDPNCATPQVSVAWN